MTTKRHHTACLVSVKCWSQELKAREDDLNRALIDQQVKEQSLRRREKELLVREFEVVEREIQLIMLQQQSRPKPPIGKRTKPVRRKLLDKYRNGTQYISGPSGMIQLLRDALHSRLSQMLFVYLADCLSHVWAAKKQTKPMRCDTQLARWP